MKKKIWIPILLAIFLLAILFVPIPSGIYKDGGTRAYTALTYKIVKWSRLTNDSVYKKTRFYFFPDNFKSIDELWGEEVDKVERIASDLRHLEYTEEWLDKSAAEKYDDAIFNDIVITQIYANCFFATPVIPMPYEIKVNVTLSENWCVGDQVSITYKNTYYDKANGRVEVDMLTIMESDFEIDPNACYKPVIYLYPERETQVSVSLMLDGHLTCTYPAYHKGWTVTAAPDGTLTDSDGRTYNYLYWEGETFATYDMSKGFCVKGEDTSVFLEEALAKLGLTRREANEFIVYWLPRMQDNPYNLITFQTDAYTEHARLHISPEPDSLLRVFMVYQPLQEPVTIDEPVIEPFERNGFTVVEWGGTEVR